MTPRPTPCGIYVRISSDPTGRGLGVARQEKACRVKAKERGWQVHRVYRDNDVSASTGKRRPEYEAMLADLESGVIGAVVVWDLDRLTRRPIEVEHFIDLADRHHVALASVGGDVDLATDNGRMFARIKGAVARAEIERKSTRQRAANDQRAESGEPNGGRRAFGYLRGGRDIEPAEAGEFKRAVDRLLDGVPVRAIARDWNERGVRTTAGNEWGRTEVRRLLMNPRHAGLRVHRGAVVGPATWPPIIDEDTHRAVVAVLTDPARQPKGRPRKYLLSGVGRCGVCGGRIYGRQERRGPLYVCESGAHLGRRAEPVDAYVEKLVVDRFSQPDAVDLFAAPDDTDARRTEAARLQGERRRAEARMNGLAEAFAVGDIDRRQLAAGTTRLRSQIADIDGRLPGLVVTPALGPLIGASDVRAAWDALDVAARRSAIDFVANVIVDPAGRGVRNFDPRTVRVVPKGG